MNDGLNAINMDVSRDIDNDDMDIKYLTFKIDNQFFGMSIRHVIEIVQIQPATAMPDLPYYAKGIINLRGRVVPLIDVNLRFGKPEKEYTDRTCIIIVDIDGVHIGFIVDAVEEVLDITPDMISPPPRFSAADENRYVTGVCKLETYMVLLLDSRMMFSDTDMSLFA
jgi:purine-binding chemotaxis protein CheW